jgi:hypothetical protein
MSSNPDEIYRAKVAVEPVAPATLWIYPQLKLVSGSRQRPVLAVAKRKASIPWLYKVLMLCWASVLALKIWASETGRSELHRITEYSLLLVLFAFLALLVIQVMRTRKFLRLEVKPDHSDAADA